MDTKFPQAPKPMNMRLVGGAVAGAFVLAGVVLWATNTLEPKAMAAPATSQAAAEPTIEITDTGFKPANLKVKRGVTVHWVNKTASPHQVASNPYPEHTDLPGLYVATPLSPEDDYSYTFDRAGTWGYHDPINPTVGGTVVVD